MADGTLLFNRYISFIKVGESVSKLLYVDREEAAQATHDNPDRFTNLLNLCEPQSEKVLGSILALRPFCGELTGSRDAGVDSLRVLRLSPTVQNMRVQWPESLIGLCRFVLGS